MRRQPDAFGDIARDQRNQVAVREGFVVHNQHGKDEIMAPDGWVAPVSGSLDAIQLFENPVLERHAMHHYTKESAAFGVCTTLWDHVFGTVPRRRLR